MESCVGSQNRRIFWERTELGFFIYVWIGWSCVSRLVAVDGPPRVGPLFGCVPSRLIVALLLFWIEGPHVVNFFFSTLLTCVPSSDTDSQIRGFVEVVKIYNICVCFDIICVSYYKICVICNKVKFITTITNIIEIHTFYFYNSRHTFITTYITFITKYTYFIKINTITGPKCNPMELRFMSRPLSYVSSSHVFFILWNVLF